MSPYPRRPSENRRGTIRIMIQSRNYINFFAKYKRFSLLFLVVIIACPLLWGLFRMCVYSPNAFSGDGEFSDTGFWSYPRYHLVLPKIQSGADKIYTFSFRGVPRESFYLGLAVADPGHSRLSENVKSSITIGVKLRDERGNTLCEVRSPLTAWTESWSVTRVLFWNVRCRSLELRRDCSYTVQLTIEADDRSLAPIVFVPILEGGGIETP